MVIALGLVFLAVNRASIDSAMAQINEDLDATARAFQRVIEDRNRNLLERARFLSSDHAYRQIYAFGEREDIEVATFNHQRRLGADLMMLVSMDEEVLANTLAPGEEVMSPEIEAFVYKAFDSDDGEAMAMLLVDRVPYQLVIVPLYAPEPVAMVIVGFKVDAPLVQELKTDTNFTDLSLMFGVNEAVSVTAACTLEQALCDEQSVQLLEDPPKIGEQSARILGGEPFITRVLPLQAGDSNNIALLQRSLNEELAPYYALRNVLLAIFGGSLFLSVLGGSLLSGTVTRPVALLVEGARRIARGEYDSQVNVQQQDEIGRLAGNFNDMAKGLKERDQVRNLLGKVVSPQIAEELMSKDIELGGEEVEASILFSDIRSFTSISEAMTPQQVIEMLNHYLTEMNAIIEQYSGVVDKYIGDAVMAIYGAPLAHPESAQNAVASALAMQRAMAQINLRFQDWGIPPLAIGIGINTGTVVAGNMGSMTRLNYTVLGDAVNLASRVEGLCKNYGSPIIITDSTRQACGDMACLELDRVTVKGKSEPVTLFRPILDGEIGLEELETYQSALDAYRACDWDLATRYFTTLQQQFPGELYSMYLDRLRHFASHPPAEDWDGVFVLTTK